MLGVFAGGVIATVLVGLMIFVVCCWISDDKETACNRARSNGFNDGYVKGEQSEREDWEAEAIENGFAFRDPVYGRFTWKVAAKPEPVDLNDALPKAG